MRKGKGYKAMTAQSPEATKFSVVKMAQEALEDIYNQPPEERVIEIYGEPAQAESWLTGLLKEAYVAGHKRGVKDGHGDLV